MSVRKTSAKLGVATLAVAGLALTVVAPAGAVDALPSGGTVLGTDFVGAGSDTTQWVMDNLTTDYNASVASGPHLANYDACLGNATVAGPNPDGTGFPCGADGTGTKAGVARPESVVSGNSANTGALPNGSGSGRALLRTPGDPLFSDVAYARSSGPISSTDQANGLAGLPFAVDKIVVATNPNGPAPAALSGQQILRIFQGVYTNWAQVGGANAPIHPYMPKNGSSTLAAFQGFLAGLDGKDATPGGASDPSAFSAAKQKWQGPGAVTTANWNTGTVNVEEHDPSVIINDPNAIEPFSYGRAQLANKNTGNVRMEGGWSADRELYNVVRTQDISGAATTPFKWGADSGALEAVFGNSGWICTNATATADVASNGFWPIAPALCGVKNTNTLDTINPYASNGSGEGVGTTTSATLSGSTVNVNVAAQSGSTVPTGSVVVSVLPAGGTAFSQTVALTNGAGSVTVPSTVSGAVTIDASYLPTGFGQNGAAGHATLGSSYAHVSGSIAGTTTASPVVHSIVAPHGVIKVKKGKATISITVKGYRGTLVIKSGKKVIARVVISRDGVVTLRIKAGKLKSGAKKYTVVLPGAPTQTIKIKK